MNKKSEAEVKTNVGPLTKKSFTVSAHFSCLIQRLISLEIKPQKNANICVPQ